YYLAHEDERAAIAQNGHRKVRKNHSYLKAFSEMLDVAGI
nr:glycosyltransferase [Lachnospiraceae bacterium]